MQAHVYTDEDGFVTRVMIEDDEGGGYDVPFEVHDSHDYNEE